MYDELVFRTDHFTTWQQFESSVKHLYDKWMVEYKQDVKALMREARKNCLNMRREHPLLVIDFLNTFCKKFVKKSTFMIGSNVEDVQYMFGPFTLSRLFAISVSPVLRSSDEINNPSISTLFKLDLDATYQNNENAVSFRDMELFLECNGLVVEVKPLSNNDDTTEVSYRPVCVPRFYYENYQDLDARYGENYCNTIDLSRYTIFENPTGIQCQLYYYNGEWRISSSDQYSKWYLWVMKKDDEFKHCTESRFKELWNELGMQYPSMEDAFFNFFFVFQEKSRRIIFKGYRSLDTFKECKNWKEFGNKYHWKDQVNTLNYTSMESLIAAVNDFNMYSPSEFEGVECIDFENCEHGFQLRSSLRFRVPFLRLTNINYITSIIDQDIVANPPMDLVTSKYNLDLLVSILLQSTLSAVDKSDELAIEELNRIFLPLYRKLKNSYLTLCKLIDDFYNNSLLNIENDYEQFNEKCKDFLEGKVRKSSILFANLRKFRNKMNSSLMDIAYYWKTISRTKKETASEVRFITALLKMMSSSTTQHESTENNHLLQIIEE